jgi:Steigviridae/Suoliviridae L,D-carboxypeptidase/transpeptidase
MKFEVIRYEYLEDRTLGVLEIDGKHFCYTLEDRVRPPGEKVYGETAIPEGNYTVTIEPFRGDKSKLYPYLHDVSGFTGVCVHGGNKPEDSLGCILVAFNKDDATHQIQGSAVLKLVEEMKKNKEIKLIVRNGG